MDFQSKPGARVGTGNFVPATGPGAPGVLAGFAQYACAGPADSEPAFERPAGPRANAAHGHGAPSHSQRKRTNPACPPKL
jgi:hypothetical protein